MTGVVAIYFSPSLPNGAGGRGEGQEKINVLHIKGGSGKPNMADLNPHQTLPINNDRSLIPLKIVS